MKLFLSTVLFTLCSQVVQGKSAPIGAGTPVQLAVRCEGMDMAQLNTVEKMVLTQVLQDSFADVSGTKSGGSALTVTEKVSWRCGRSCRDDDYVMTEEIGSNGEMTLGGFWRCGRSCRDDDDANFGLTSGVRNGATMAWEKNFVEKLTAISSPTFQLAEKCSISMSTEGNTDSA